MAKLSIVVPSRDERFLTPTIDDIFRNARGDDTEVIAVLDSDKWPGDWKEVTARHSNLHTIHNGRSIGMRGSINKGVASAISRGARFIMKLDGHCSLGEGFDEILKAECDADWVVVPRRLRLDPENWTIAEPEKQPHDYHYLSFPDDPNDFGGPGLNGKPWFERQKERVDILLDDEMSSQGSCWFMHADYFRKLELMDEAGYGPFWNEFQECGLKCWLSGGQVKVNKRTYYAHLHKGKKYGRGYRLPEAALVQGRNHTMKWIWNEAWGKQTLPFSWLIQRFWPVPSWPDNWEEVLYAERRPRVLSSGVDNNPDLSSAGEPASDAALVQPPEAAAGSVKADDYVIVDGLQILLGAYGVSFGIGPNTALDVTERLKTLVKDNALDIVVNNSTLCPDQNPFRGKKKRLWVTYRYGDGEITTIEREEKEWLIIGQAQERTVEGTSDFIPALTLPVDKVIEHYEAGLNVPTAQNTVKSMGLIEAQRHEFEPPRTPSALNDYLIRKFSISPQRLRGPMPIELRDFHRNDLAQLFAELGFKRGAEIGVAEGNYSEILLKANPECELLLVDVWSGYTGNPQNKPNDKHLFAYNETVRKTKDYKHVDIQQGYSMDVVDGIPYGSLDFCYVDANHLFDECVQDIIEWSKRVRSGGIVSGDDYYALDQKRWIGGGVVEAVQAYTNAHRIPIWYLFQGHKSVDFMWVKP